MMLRKLKKKGIVDYNDSVIITESYQESCKSSAKGENPKQVHEEHDELSKLNEDDYR